ncbi:MAG: O-antigen polysaccharide polymerase Wzy [Lacunisphaera sp.]
MPTIPPFGGVTDSEHAYALLGGDNARRGEKLFNTGLALLAGALIYLGYNAHVSTTLHLYQGLIIFTLSFVPGLLWAKSGGSRFPVFEAIMLLCANAYAIPLFQGQEQLLQYAPEVISTAGWAVILYQVTAITVYQLTSGRPGESNFWNQEMLGQQVEKFVVYGLILSSAYVVVSTFTTWIPDQLGSVLRAAFFGIGILCTFISCQRWGRGELTEADKAIVICTLVPQMIVQTMGLLLIDSLSLLGIALLGYLSGGKRVPWFVMLSSFFIFAVLHNGKSQMREKYWEPDAIQPGITDLPAFYSEWIGYGLKQATEYGDATKITTGQKLLERTSLIHILCLVINYSPDRQPFLHGETYGYVVPQLIPRIFWSGKPRSHVATYRLAVYYGLQDEDATNETTIAFGMLTEAYANFGMLGSVLLGLFWGFGLKKLQLLSWHSPMFSLAGLMMILLTAWSFGSELTMAAWISSLYQAMIVVLGVPLVLRKLLGW